jgi:hypothetical protein
MSAAALGTAMDAFFMAAGGGGFARLGWSGLRRRAAAPAPAVAGESTPAPMQSLPWKLLWGFCLLFGTFVALCGLFLGLSVILPE